MPRSEIENEKLKIENCSGVFNFQFSIFKSTPKESSNGGIVIGKRELSALEEETVPSYILEKVETEKEVKEAMNA